MKKILFLTFLAPTLFAQTVTYQKAVMVNYIDVDKASFQYMTGSDKIPGYDIKVLSIEEKKETKKFSNGKTAPILQVYVSNKNKYIGGILEDDKGSRTIIKNITLVEYNNTLVFTVQGSLFSKSFTLEIGSILKEEDNNTIFHTDKIGIWKINKK
jgi:hypothetical protein